MRLGEICKIKYGKDHKKLADGKIPVYGSGGIMRYAEKALYDKKSVLIPRKGSLDNLYFVSEPFWTVDTLFYTEIDEQKTIPEYLYYFLKTLDFAGMNVGTAVPSLTTAVLNEIEIDLPNLETQCAIANILSALDARITENKKINHHLAVRLATDNSPDMRRGSKVSRRVARCFDSSVLNEISSNIGLTESLKSCSLSDIGITTGNRLSSPKLMYFWVLPANLISIWLTTSELRRKHSKKYTQSSACEVLKSPTFLMAKLMSRSITSEVSPIVPIMLIRMSCVLTLLRSLILSKSTLLMRLDEFKSTPYGKRCFEVTSGKPCSTILGESCVPSRTSISSPRGVVSWVSECEKICA